MYAHTDHTCVYINVAYSLPIDCPPIVHCNGFAVAWVLTLLHITVIAGCLREEDDLDRLHDGCVGGRPRNSPRAAAQCCASVRRSGPNRDPSDRAGAPGPTAKARD